MMSDNDDTLQMMVAELDAMGAPTSADPDPAAAPGGTPDTTPTSVDFDEDAPPDDPVARMQAMLIEHERAGAHQVENPALTRVLDELQSVAYANIADFFEHAQASVITGIDDEGEAIVGGFERLALKDITRLPRHLSASVKKIKCTRKPTGDVIELEMVDKLSALDKLMRYHGAYERDNAQTAAGVSTTMDFLLSAIGGGGLPTLEDNSA